MAAGRSSAAGSNQGGEMRVRSAAVTMTQAACRSLRSAAGRRAGGGVVQCDAGRRSAPRRAAGRRTLRAPGALLARLARRFPLIVAVLLLVPKPLDAQRLNFRNYTAVDGLPQAQVLALHQDARGYLWIGTYGGLSRFNGGEFRTHRLSDGLVSNAISSISEDRTGRIFAASIGGGVCVLEAGAAIRCIGDADGLPHHDVYSLAYDTTTDAIWAATGRGAARIRGNTIDTFGEGAGTPGQVLSQMAFDDDGALWVGGNRGVARFDGERFIPQFADELGSAAVAMVAHSPWGMLISAGTRLFLANGDALQELFVPGLPAGTTFTDASREPGGGVWITTRAGVLHFDGERFERHTTESGLLFDQVTRVRVDREGSIWFGTERGLSRLTPGPFRHYSTGDGLPNPFVRAIAADTSGRIWFGTRNGVAVREGDRFRTLELGARVTDRRVFSLAGMTDGSMLIGTRDGLALHDGERTRAVFTTAHGLPGNVVFALLPDGERGAWVGTDRGLARWEPGSITSVVVPGVDDLFIIALAYDAEGRVWIGRRSGGVVIYDGYSAELLGAAEGLTDQTIWSIRRAPDGAMWIGSNGDGVFRVAGSDATTRVIRQVDTRAGLIDDSIWQVQPDANGVLWLYTSQGIDRLTPDGVQHYGRGRGLLELEGGANASWLDRNGELWLGTSMGVVRYTPALDVVSPVAPPIYIEGLTSGADTLALHGARVRAGRGVLKVRFASPAFRDESGMRYRYRLLGTDTGWSDPTAERSIGYAGLGPGSYEFQVYAIDPDGRMSDRLASVGFAVTPLYWQTWWFRLAGLLLVLAFGAALGVARTRALRAEQRRLELLVAERTSELRAKNADLEREVDERHRMERALSQSEQRIREIVEHSTNMFYSHLPDGTITYISPQSRRLLGCEPAEALRRYSDFVTDHEVNARGAEMTQRAIETGEKQPPYELQLRAVDGTIRWVEVNEAPVTRNGETLCLVGSLTDITETKTAAAEQERLHAQLRQAQKMEAVGRLAGGIAHDFNNLLTAVVGNTDLVATGIEPTHPLQTELAQIRRAADRAASLVTQLLAFSRQQLIRRSVLDLNTIVTDSARMLARMIGADVELHLDLATEPLYIEADQAQLDQVLINLALNARDAMPEGGRLNIATLAVEIADPRLERIDEDIAPGPYVVLRITDNGHGMDAETIGHIFEPFFTTKEVGRGTGLGLATVYGIVTQNGGAVTIDSVTDHGTTFHVYLPCARRLHREKSRTTGEESVAAAAAAGAEPVTTDGNGVVLVVEDEDAVRRLVCRTLERYGFRVLDAHDGARALEICGAHDGTIDLLLTDMVMPGMNGRDVATRVSAARPGVRVLYMSGHTQDVLGKRFMLDDATQIVQKPFGPADLVHRVREVMAGSPAAASAS